MVIYAYFAPVFVNNITRLEIIVKFLVNRREINGRKEKLFQQGANQKGLSEAHWKRYRWCGSILVNTQPLWM
jgi:hypothetical protein